jgi:hypothetical protein
MNRFLPLWPHRFPHFVYIHLGGGGVGAQILDRCRALDLFASVDVHLCTKGSLESVRYNPHKMDSSAWSSHDELSNDQRGHLACDHNTAVQQEAPQNGVLSRIEQNPSLLYSKPVHYQPSYVSPYMRELHLNEQPSELRCTLISYSAPLSYDAYCRAAPY